MGDVSLSEDLPTSAEFIALRQQMGWGVVDDGTARRTIECACFTVCLRREGRLVGLGRIMGDGALYFSIADVIIAPELQGGGHGVTLMNALTAYLKRAATPGASITLQPLKGREGFYERFGFVRCPTGPFGAGMVFADAPPPIGGSL
jgi:predicted GNAT family N-acyltransferase